MKSLSLWRTRITNWTDRTDEDKQFSVFTQPSNLCVAQRKTTAGRRQLADVTPSAASQDAS